MTVYRIEHEIENTGPYNSPPHIDTSNLWDMAWRHGETLDRPTPTQEFGCEVMTECDSRCGFSSMEQLHAWFEPIDLIVMGNLGFMIKEFEDVRIIQAGEKQVVFIKNSS